MYKMSIKILLLDFVLFLRIFKEFFNQFLRSLLNFHIAAQLFKLRLQTKTSLKQIFRK